MAHKSPSVPVAANRSSLPVTHPPVLASQHLTIGLQNGSGRVVILGKDHHIRNTVSAWVVTRSLTKSSHALCTNTASISTHSDSDTRGCCNDLKRSVSDMMLTPARRHRRPATGTSMSQKTQNRWVSENQVTIRCCHHRNLWNDSHSYDNATVGDLCEPPRF